MLERLDKFKAAFSSKSNGSKDENAGGKDVLPDWMGVQLKFAPDPVKVILQSFMYRVLYPVSLNVDENQLKIDILICQVCCCLEHAQPTWMHSIIILRCPVLGCDANIVHFMPVNFNATYC